MEEIVREVLAQHAGLKIDAMSIGGHADLFDAGMSSHASVNVMLSLEEALDVEFPNSALTKSTFTSISSILQALHPLNPASV